MKTRRLAFYILLGFGAVLIVCAIVLLTIDLGRYKPRVEAIVSEATGREFSIRGNFAPSLGRKIRVVAEDIHLGATDWSEFDDLVEVRKLDVVIDTWSLVSGPLEIESITLDGVRVHLEKNDGNVNNWTIGQNAEDAEPAEDQTDRPNLPFVLHAAEVTDFRLTYRAPGRNEPLVFASSRISQAILPNDVLNLSMEGLLNDTRVRLDAEITPAVNLVEYRDIGFSIQAAVGEITVDGKGEIDDLLSPTRPSAQFDIAGPGAAYLLQVLREEPFTDGPLSFKAVIKPDGDDIGVDVSGVFGEFNVMGVGRFDNLQDMQNFDLTLQAEGPDIGTLVRLANKEYADKDPFNLQARLHRAGSLLVLDDVLLTIGESRLHASGRFANFPMPGGAEGQLDVGGPDFGRFNRLFGLPGRLGGPFTLAATLEPLPDGRTAIRVESSARDIRIEATAEVSEAADLAGSRANVRISGSDISVVAAAAGFDQAPQESFNVQGSVERVDNGVVLNDLQANIGDLRFALDGIVGNRPLAETTDLRFDISGTDIAKALRTFRVKGDRLPRGEFRAVGHVFREVDHFVLENVHASIGDDQAYVVSVDGKLSDMPDRRGSALVLGVRGGSLAAVAEVADIEGIPDVAYDISAKVERLQGAYRISDGSFTLGTVTGTLAGSVGDNPLNRDTDLSVGLKVPDLAYSLGKFGLDAAHLPAEPLTATGRIRNRSERLRVENLTVNLAGMDAQVDGAVGEPPLLNGTDLELRLQGPNLARLLPDARRFSALDKSYRANTRIVVANGTASLRALSLTIGNTQMSGELSVATSPALSAGSFDLAANSPDLFALMPRLADISVPQQAPMRFKGAGRWSERYWEFDDVNLALGEGSLRLSGKIDGPPDYDRTNFNFDWKIESVRNYSILLGRELPDHPAHLRARLTGTKSEMKMEEFVGRVGDSDISGEFRMRGGEKPFVTVAFNSDRLNLAPYLPPLDSDEDDDESADGRVIPDTALPLEFLGKFDADVDVTVRQLIGRSITVDDVKVEGSVANADLRIDKLSLTGPRGGTLAAQLLIDSKETGAADVTVSATGSRMILGLQVSSAVELDALPHYDVSIEATGNGTTLRQLASTLDGGLRMTGGEGKIAPGSLSLLTGDVFDQVLSTINPFVRTDRLVNVECSALLLQFADGVVTGNPALVQKTDKLLILANANIDLASERMRVEVSSVPQRGLGLSLSRLVTPYVLVTGTLARPSLSLDPEGALIEGGAAVATGGLSILAKTFRDRFLSSRDPCGDAVRRHDEKVAAAGKAGGR